ncbi:EF-hand domain-containing protein [Pontivivens nitratireducens]|uniref:EF-hand domain-containing protein n=1 Tax=Pontivivens nitratireducens TaxID=2758038 RepID=UPI00163B5BC5|nr:EF-hand domain-containing protein [Pontibrevibacter nitratireducens]
MTSTSKTALGVTLVLALLAGATSVSAQGQSRGFDFAAIDTNGDGEVTRAEVDAHRAARFADIDTDGNGIVDQAELIAAAEARRQARDTQRAERMIERSDADGDGVLTQEELQPQPRGGDMFERMDTDGNGAISQEEIDAAREHMRDRRGDDRDGNREHGRRSHD